jgi:hypothetical protein
MALKGRGPTSLPFRGGILSEIGIELPLSPQKKERRKIKEG